MSAQAKSAAPRTNDLRDRARVVAVGLFFYAAARFGAAFLAGRALAALAVQAAIAEWATGFVGIAWSDPRAPIQGVGAAAKRALRGAAFALAAAAIALATMLALRSATIARPSLAIGALATGAISAGLLAVQRELFLRGLVLRVLSAAPQVVQLIACGLASAATAIGESDSGIAPIALAAAFFGGAACGALWLRDRGAWMAWGAQATWLLTMRTIATGALDIASTASASTWSGGDSGLDAGAASAVALAATGAVGATVWAIRDRVRA